MPAIDPELQEGLSFFPPLELTPERLVEMRRAGAALPIPELSPAVVCEELRIEGWGDAPAVRLLVYRPRSAANASGAGVLDIHGGGYILGSPQMGQLRNGAPVEELGCTIVSVDYRLAPETAFPGAVEDCYAALKWFHRKASELGVDPGRIGVSGMSAGGGLAAALALYVRDKGEALLAFQHLIYPMIDDRTCTRAPNAHIGQHVWTHADNTFGWRALLGSEPGGAGVSAHAAASRAEDLSGLPPTFIAVGALDLFLQENLDYVNRLAHAGVPVEAHVYPGAYHGFHIAQAATVTRAAERDSHAALQRFCR
jgi:triacylglycerol lipase